MSLKTSRWLQAVMAAILAGTLTAALISQNIIYALVGAVAFVIAVRISPNSTKEVVADERDLGLIGKAARASLRLFGPVGAAVAFIFLYEGRFNPTYETIGVTLVCAVAGLLVLYKILMEYYRRGESTAARIFLTVGIILLALIIEIVVTHFLR